MDAIKMAIVTGRVQKVGFRAATQKQAKKLQIKGWTRNLDTGEVEVVYKAPSLEALSLFEEFLHKGPLMAKVQAVEIELSSIERFANPPPEAFVFEEQ
ncbi:MAG: acylphosphatase [Legionellales bacterium]|nr:acylphosphatase [Legionellales bacterium]|tara:strand:+ start:1720 stop:2013 length:294 start_codon:yes stop_codon:yes gene_type:complete